VSNPDKWDYSASGHVDEGEGYLEAAYRELKEEVGVEGVELKEVTKYYQVETDERARKRFNTIYTAMYDGPITPDMDEVTEARWIMPDELERWMHERPDDFTQGFIRSFEEFVKK